MGCTRSSRSTAEPEHRSRRQHFGGDRRRCAGSIVDLHFLEPESIRLWHPGHLNSHRHFAATSPAAGTVTSSITAFPPGPEPSRQSRNGRFHNLHARRGHALHYGCLRRRQPEPGQQLKRIAVQSSCTTGRDCDLHLGRAHLRRRWHSGDLHSSSRIGARLGAPYGHRQLHVGVHAARQRSINASGVAAISPVLAAGAYEIVATYEGNANALASASVCPACSTVRRLLTCSSAGRCST